MSHSHSGLWDKRDCSEHSSGESPSSVQPYCRSNLNFLTQSTNSSCIYPVQAPVPQDPVQPKQMRRPLQGLQRQTPPGAHCRALERCLPGQLPGRERFCTAHSQLKIMEHPTFNTQEDSHIAHTHSCMVLTCISVVHSAGFCTRRGSVLSVSRHHAQHLCFKWIL